MFYDGGWFMGGMHFLWWIFWIALVGVLLWTAWGRRDGRRDDQQRERRETPHEVLQRRLANGECTPEEYEQRKALLDRDAAAKK